MQTGTGLCSSRIVFGQLGIVPLLPFYLMKNYQKFLHRALTLVIECQHQETDIDNHILLEH